MNIVTARSRTPLETAEAVWSLWGALASVPMEQSNLDVWEERARNIISALQIILIRDFLMTSLSVLSDEEAQSYLEVLRECHALATPEEAPMVAAVCAYVSAAFDRPREEIERYIASSGNVSLGALVAQGLVIHAPSRVFKTSMQFTHDSVYRDMRKVQWEELDTK